VNLSQIRATLVSTLAARYPTVKVEAHGGRFSEKEVALLLSKAPALRVGCIGFPSLTAQGPAQWKADTDWALYVFAADTATSERDVLALDLVQDLMLWLPDQRWGLDASRLMARDSLTAENLYTGTINILRVALWAVTWTQPFLLTSSP